MIGVVLAAGMGSRLGALTAELPKSLLSVHGDVSILESIAINFRDVGLTDAVVVAGFAAEMVQAAVPGIRRRTGLELNLLYNNMFNTLNNAHSLWLARDHFAEGVLLCNGDTFHPASVPARLLARCGAPVTLAVDDQKVLGQEEMKVCLGSDGEVQQISKSLTPSAVDGEYIGVAVIDPAAAVDLADSLEFTWRTGPTLYYEDGFQEFLRRGGRIAAASIGAVPWVEVDTPADLAQARSIAPRVLGAGVPAATGPEPERH